MKFSLPSTLSLDEIHEFERAAILSGPDGMPSFAQVDLEPSKLVLTRTTEESGCLTTPWLINGLGQLMAASATLGERAEAYQLPLELARGKLNQLRNQLADWAHGGLQIPAALTQQIKDATHAFTRAISRLPSDESVPLAANALLLASKAADELIHVYTTQVFQYRCQHQAKLDSVLACRIGPGIPEKGPEASFLKTFNGVSIPFLANEISKLEGDYEWKSPDEMVTWAASNALKIVGGPLIDFSPAAIPTWMWLHENNRNRLVSLIREYVGCVLDRYQDSITRWQLTAGSNNQSALRLNDEEILWLTLQMGEAALVAMPKAEIILGISQPWGDYLASEERTYTPFIFVDTLLRSGLEVSAIDLEIVMGVSPRGSYCRDLLDFSRLLDLYALLGVPLQVTLGYPADSRAESNADVQLTLAAGRWRGGLDPQTQADWAAEFAALALSKPFVRTVTWIQFSDAKEHQFPNCGLLDPTNNSRPALERLRKLREKYLN